MPYPDDVLARHRRARPAVPEVPATPGLVVEDRLSGWAGAVAGIEHGSVVLVDRRGRSRLFPLRQAAFLLEGRPVTLVREAREPRPAAARRTASGSVAAPEAQTAQEPRAKVARASRIAVEGIHDAELLERVWGDDLRDAAVVVEVLDGIDDLEEVVRAFAPGPGRRLGVLVDHLVPGSKESRIAAAVHGPHVLVTGHPYVDVWAAVRPRVIGLAAWPQVPRGTPWKEGVCAALGEAEPRELWRRLLARVDGYADLETPLVGAVERLLDFLLEPGGS